MLRDLSSINVTNTGGNNYRLPQILEGAALVEQIQNRIRQRDVKSPAFMKYAQDVFDTQGYPTKTMLEYQDELGGLLGGAMVPEQGPLGPGLVGGIPPARNPGSPGGVSLDSFKNIRTTPTQLPIGGAPRIGGPAIMGPGPDNIANQPANPTPIDNTGIGSLTPAPVNQIPESSSIAGSMTSPYMNNNQDFDQYLNSYINNQINTRMRDIFSGIMNIFK
jgi:hypothetical protein